ncbi:Pr6Pr family membrane protein [Frondihabitans australicus]|uniref:FAR-17a/AIG1-like protein n=1 Tax=Frondihabitans australicus TaxID=386892 RepID=A0A495ILB1_9MICO|nr:Pr6Pr family membrane protein [Frondihabitans australicus]RKR75946.1 hypothetical protein C8E83_3110 [Frondihabitans australicus]
MTTATAAAAPARAGRELAFRILSLVGALVVAVALVIQITLLLTGGADANSGATTAVVGLPVRFVRLFSYFTIDSNIAVMIVGFLLAANPNRTSRLWQVARLNALLAITITGIVFDVVLSKSVHLTGGALVATILLHYISPWWTVAVWLLFGPRPGFGWATIPGAFVLPVLWLLYTFVHGGITGWYPYPFLDASKIGLGPAVVASLLVLVIGLVLAVVFVLVSTRVPALIAGPPATSEASRSTGR